jgi:hypothetical protein
MLLFRDLPRVQIPCVAGHTGTHFDTPCYVIKVAVSTRYVARGSGDDQADRRMIRSDRAGRVQCVPGAAAGLSAGT